MTVDRISQLPDDVLHHILSFVNAKHAVQTSVLAHRWRYVWISMNTLNFDFNSYPFDGPDGFELKADSFKRFILGYLSRNSCMSIQKFNYFFVEQDISLNDDIFKEVFSHVVRRNVQDICVYTSDSLPVDCCTLLSTCESLNDVNLVARCGVAWNSFSNSTVTSLYLEDYDWELRLEGDLVLNCPNLKTLVLKQFDLSDLRISSEKLTVLEFSHVFFPCDSELVLLTPMLKSLKLDFVGLLPLVHSNNLSSIEKVELLRAPESGFVTIAEERIRLVMRNLISVFMLVSNTKLLVLSMELAELMMTDPNWIRRRHTLLPNLRGLKLIKDNGGNIKQQINLFVNFYSGRNVNVELIDRVLLTEF